MPDWRADDKLKNPENSGKLSKSACLAEQKLVRIKYVSGNRIWCNFVRNSNERKTSKTTSNINQIMKNGIHTINN